jgi:hypothetical protein
MQSYWLIFLHLSALIDRSALVDRQHYFLILLIEKSCQITTVPYLSQDGKNMLNQAHLENDHFGGCSVFIL